MQDTGAYTRTDPKWQQQQPEQPEPEPNVCDECAKRCTRRKTVLSFLVQGSIKIVHAIKGIFS